MNIKFLLSTILLAGFLLRITMLGNFPPSPNWDEISHGYNAFSILKTGSDEWDKFLPIDNFRAYGDYPLPLNLYITIPFISVFGLNEFAIRFPHAILGTLTILSSYFLAWGIFKDKRISLLVSLLVSFSPWYFFTSRVVFQSNLSVFLLITSMAIFVNRHKNKWFLPMSFFLLGMTLYSYHSTRIFTPIFMIVLTLIYKREVFYHLKMKDFSVLFTIGILLLFFAPLPFILSNPESRARSNVVFLVNQGAIDKIESLRNSSQLPNEIKRLVYNRFTYLLEEIPEKYMKYYSPQFLFFNGGTQYQFSVPNHGLSYLVNLPFFYIGILVLFRKIFDKSKENKLLIAWFLLGPVVASLTIEDYAVLRSTTMLPLPEILIALGFFSVFDNLKLYYRKIILVTYFFIFALLTQNYLANYFIDYPKNYSQDWQYGYKESVNLALNNYDKYDNIIFTKKYGEPHEFLLFYSKWNPSNYKSDPNLIRYGQSNWFWVDAFDKFYFVNDWQIPKDSNKFILESGKEFDCAKLKCLLVTSPGNYPNNWSKLNTINFLNGKTAFEIYENK